MATHSSILVGKILQTEEPGSPQTESQSDMTEHMHTHTGLPKQRENRYTFHILLFFNKSSWKSFQVKQCDAVHFKDHLIFQSVNLPYLFQLYPYPQSFYLFLVFFIFLNSTNYEQFCNPCEYFHTHWCFQFFRIDSQERNFQVNGSTSFSRVDSMTQACCLPGSPTHDPVMD